MTKERERERVQISIVYRRESLSSTVLLFFSTTGEENAELFSGTCAPIDSSISVDSTCIDTWDGHWIVFPSNIKTARLICWHMFLFSLCFYSFKRLSNNWNERNSFLWIDKKTKKGNIYLVFFAASDFNRRCATIRTDFEDGRVDLKVFTVAASFVLCWLKFKRDNASKER